MAIEPRRGEIWTVELDPTRGSEIQKTRPVVVISSDAMNRIPIRIVAPITTYQIKHEKQIWAVKVEATDGNGLLSKSTILPEQCRAVSLERFVRIEGSIAPYSMEELDAAIKIIFDLR